MDETPEPHPSSEQEREPPSREPSRRAVAIAVAAIAVLAAAGGAAFLIVPEGSHATLEIEVRSDLLVETEVTLYLDGRDMGSLRLGEMGAASLTCDFSWSLFEDSKAVEVRARSTGGYLGTQPDAETVCLEKGGFGKVALVMRYPSCHSRHGSAPE
ncbi:MAG: hypothetical protein LBG62_01705 [Candidatus Methanoplasma sp.]|jgi:hypothetical protein|nr:hypothetical protein [Candidatus Methanoplasma sp.]